MIPLEFLRSVQAQYLPDSCSIQRGTETAGSDGNAMNWNSPGIIASGVACRVSPLASGATESLGGGQAVRAVADWTIWLPALTDVRTADRLLVGSRVFEVQRVGARSYETARECLCSEVT